MARSNIIPVLQALFVTFLWSSSWVLIKLGLEEIPALTFAGMRYGLAFLILAPFVLGTRELRRSLTGLPAAGWLRLVALGLLFYTLTPKAYRKRRYPKWPGALATCLWWLAVTAALPPAIRGFFSYDATYGSLAGIMIALFFFYLVGLGFVIGAELNAALAETPEEALNRIGQADDRERKKARAAAARKAEQESEA